MKIKTAQTNRSRSARRTGLRPSLYRALISAGIVATTLVLPAYADDMADVSKLLRAGKVVEALNKTNEFLAKHPADPQMRFMKGVLLTEQNKADEAIAVFTKLTEDYRDLPEPYNNLAVLYASQGQYDKARVALEKAIRTNPSYMTAYENLGDVYGKMASQAYDKALALGSSSAPVKSKLTLLRTFSSSTGAKVTVPELAAQAGAPTPASTPAPAAAVARAPASANTQVQLISPIPADTGKPTTLQRIPALSVSPPATGKVAAAPAPVVAPAPAPAKVAAAPAPAVAPTPAKVLPPTPVPAPVIAAAKPEPQKATPVLLAKAEPIKPVPTPVPAPAPVAKAETAKPAAPAAPVKPEPAKVVAAKAEPVKAEPAKPAKPDTTEHDAVLNQVHGWAKAWAAQNVDSYLGYYSNEFEPPKGMTRKAWADERRARIEGKGRIHVDVGAPEVVVNGNTAKVSFRQTYESDRLTARSHKTLVLIKNGGKWQIKQESSGS